MRGEDVAARGGGGGVAAGGGWGGKTAGGGGGGAMECSCDSEKKEIDRKKKLLVGLIK